MRDQTRAFALDRITFVNRLFYKVLDPNTIIVVDEQAAKRRTYDERVLRTFYLENAETKDIETLIKTGIGSQTLTVSYTSGSTTGTSESATSVERIFAAAGLFIAANAALASSREPHPCSRAPISLI